MAFLVFLLLVPGCGRQSMPVGPSVRVIGETGHFAQPTWSGDGKSIAVIYRGESGNDQLLTLGSDGQEPSMSKTTGEIHSPGWLDGRIVYVQGGPFGSPELMSTDGALPPEPLSPLPGAVVASWSRDGTIGILNRLASGNSTALWLLNVRTGEWQEIWAGEVAQRHEVSPTGRYLAFTNIRSSAVSVMDMETRTVRELWAVTQPGESLSGLAWSPNEKYLGVRLVGSLERNGFYVLEIGGAGREELLSTVDMVDPDWSPNGRSIVFVTVGLPGRNELCILDLPSGLGDTFVK